jgi:signal transduction histidine kinase/CheY-like chemotaxis protein/ligand-binding sensor domain-containing protein/AraC-like DNA-binding protein
MSPAKFSIFIVCFWLMSLGLLQAQHPYIVENYGLNEGLPLNAVNDLAQDSSGYLYLATNEGLVRYDGYRMSVFNGTSQPSLLADRILRLHYDSDHLLWMEHPSGSITRYDGRSFSTFGVNTDLGFVFYTVEDTQGRIWVVSANGIFVYNRLRNAFDAFPIPDDVGKMMIIEPDATGGMLGIAENGVIWKFGINGFKRFIEQTPPTRRYVERRLTSLDDTFIWITDPEGFHALDRKTGLVVWSYPSKQGLSQSISRLQDGRYVLMSDYMYLYVNPSDWSTTIEPITITHFLSNKRFLELPDGDLVMLRSDAVYFGDQHIEGIFKPAALLADLKGTIWVASQSNGLYKISKPLVENLHAINDVTIRNVYSIYECRVNPGTYRFATHEDGVVEYDGTKARFLSNATTNLPSGVMQFIYQDVDGIHYAGIHSMGLWRQLSESKWVPESGLQAVFEGQSLTVVGMFEDSASDQLFVGTNSGLGVRRAGEWYQIKDMNNDPLYSVRVFAKPDTSLALGTASTGIFLLNDRLQVSRQLTTFDGLSSNAIRDIFVQSADTLWIVTENAGLNRLIRRDSVRYDIARVDHRNGLPHNNIHRMIEDNSGRIWISSNRGIFSTTLQALNEAANTPGELITFLRIDESSGMLNREANGGVMNSGLLSSDGRLFFANQMGVTTFHPDSIFRSLTLWVPTPIIEYVADNDQKWLSNRNGKIALPENVRTFTVHFSAPNYSSQRQISVRYMLEGVDASWQSAGTNLSARYTNLRPGTYIFRLRAEQIDGTFNVTRATIIVPHRLQETIWFRLIAGLLVGGIVLLFVSYRQRNRNRLDEIQQLVDAQTYRLKELNEEKSRLFYGITHDLRHMMSLILGPLDVIRDQIQESKQVDMELFLTTERNIRNILELTEQMMEVARLSNETRILKPVPVSIYDETERIATYMQRISTEPQFQVTLQPVSQPVYVALDKTAWERVVINLILNALTHGFSSKGLHIYFVHKAEKVDIIFRDFGKGVPASNPNQVFDYQTKDAAAGGSGLGLYVVRELIQRMDGRIRAENVPQNGSRFVITLPCVKQTETLPIKAAIKPTSLEAHRDPNMPKILLVEDDAHMLTYLAEMLGAHFEVVTAVNGIEALQVAASLQPDCIVSDVVMPMMDGPALVKQLRSQSGLATIPVIFLSQKNEAADVAAGLSSGADIYLPKHITDAILISQIHALLRREKLIRDRINQATSHPDEPVLISEVTALIYRNLANPRLNPELIADSLHMSRSKLYRDWKITGAKNLNRFILELRLHEARILLEKDGSSVSEAAFAVGFREAGYFSTQYKKVYGCSPASAKKTAKT